MRTRRDAKDLADNAKERQMKIINYLNSAFHVKYKIYSNVALIFSDVLSLGSAV